MGSLCARLACLSIIAIILTAFVRPSGAAGNTPKAAVIGVPGSSQVFSSALESAGYLVSVIDPDSITSGEGLKAVGYDLLLLSDASRLPIDTIAPITDYLKGGGDVIALNAPLWGDALIRTPDGNITADEYRKSGAGAHPDHLVVDFSPESIQGWGRGASKPENSALYETIPEGPAPGARSLHVKLSNLEGWDTFGSKELADPFPHGNTLTMFYAKGGPNTTQGFMEWAEKDGSRWVAVFPLYADWRMYALTPEDFSFWQSNPARGFKGDKFNPANASVISLGLSFSFTGWSLGSHEYWIGPIGTDAVKDEYRQFIASRYLPVADTLSPGYKYFSVGTAASLVVRSDQSVIADVPLPMPSHIRSSYARPKGVGFNKAKGWRWIPLIEARTSDGRWCGNPATLLVNADGDYKGGIWASFGIGDADWYKTPQSLSMIRDIAERMAHPAFLIDGGTDCFTYFKGQGITVGARAANPRGESSAVAVRISLIDNASGRNVFTKEWALNLASDAIQTVSQVWKPDYNPRKGFSVKTEMISAGKVVDALSHDIAIYQPNKKPQFVRIKDGGFILNGKAWKPNGVNYMPSSGIAMEDGEIFGTWLSAKAYDPEVIERDIQSMKTMGMNAVSIFLFHQDLKGQNLPDILRRLDQHGMKANISLRPGTPMDFPGFPWSLVKEMIEHNQLKGNDTVFAYDLAWEPMFGSQGDRASWDGEWRNWIIERYGSVENAEKDWGYPIPRKADGSITNPNASQVGADGEWRKMMAAYRRFLDTLLYKKYGRARDLVHSIDPNHHVSFRMAEASNPEYSWGENIPYDFAYLSSAVDFLSPEAYGRVGNWDRVRPGWFQREYARLCAPAKPMIWAEMGVSAWDNGQMQQSRKLLDFQSDYFRDFYRMMISSGANGFFSWYYPGGYRYDEKSDYGIINPDGSDRPVSKTIRNMARAFADAPSPSCKEVWLEIDRDARAEGFAGVYTAVKSKFWAAIDKGLTPRLKTAGTGSTSANCPLLALGNTPCTGLNPPKYLDAAFDSVEVRNSEGRWVAVEKGASVNVAADMPVKARILVRNLNEAKWLSASGIGRVSMMVIGKDARRLPVSHDIGPHETIEFRNVVLVPGISAPGEIVLSMDADRRTPFGEKFGIKLNPLAK